LPFSKGSDARGRIWIGAFLCIGLASAAGAFVHGFALGPRGEELGRIPIDVLIGLAVSAFALGVIRDFFGDPVAKRVTAPFVTLGLLVSLVSVLLPAASSLLKVYGAVVLFSAFGVYFSLWIQKTLPGSGYVAAGILVAIIGTLIQAARAVHFRLIWDFDHNGTLHLIQIPAMVLWLKGLLPGFTEGPKEMGASRRP
jgi:hypothetical protein